MENKIFLKIPYVVHEAEMFRKERIIKRLVSALMLSQIVFSTIFLVLLKKVVKGENRGI